MKTIGAAAVLLVGVALSGCTSSGAHPTTGNPLIDHTDHDPHVVTADRGGLKTAEFELASGVTTIVLHSADIGGGLYRIATPNGAGQLPSAVIAGDHVVTQMSSSGVNGPSIVDIELSDAVLWTIHLDGGSTEANVDMRAGGLAALDFGAGVTRIDAYVPAEPDGVSVQMAGGATSFAVHAPDGMPARVTIGGGAGSATIDGVGHTGIAGGTVFAPDAWPASGSRLEIENTAGVSTFTLDRYHAPAN
jgi:hypothetical protein